MHWFIQYTCIFQDQTVWGLKEKAIVNFDMIEFESCILHRDCEHFTASKYNLISNKLNAQCTASARRESICKQSTCIANIK